MFPSLNFDLLVKRLLQKQGSKYLWHVLQVKLFMIQLKINLMKHHLSPMALIVHIAKSYIKEYYYLSLRKIEIIKNLLHAILWVLTLLMKQDLLLSSLRCNYDGHNNSPSSVKFSSAFSYIFKEYRKSFA
jgi:hypothetical protein